MSLEERILSGLTRCDAFCRFVLRLRPFRMETVRDPEPSLVDTLASVASFGIRSVGPAYESPIGDISSF